MEEVSQLIRLLALLAREQEKSPRAVWTGIGAHIRAIANLLGVDPNSAEVMAVRDAVEQASDEGLIEPHGEHFIRLTERGWMRARGAVPWSDRDDEFFNAIVHAHKDLARRKQNEWVSGVEVARSLEPPMAQENVWNLADRFHAAGLGDTHYMSGDVWFRPNYHARHRYSSET